MVRKKQNRSEMRSKQWKLLRMFRVRLLPVWSNSVLNSSFEWTIFDQNGICKLNFFHDWHLKIDGWQWKGYSQGFCDENDFRRNAVLKNCVISERVYRKIVKKIQDSQKIQLNSVDPRQHDRSLIIFPVWHRLILKANKWEESHIFFFLFHRQQLNR